jgi:hypothetical protein
MNHQEGKYPAQSACRMEQFFFVPAGQAFAV